MKHMIRTPRRLVVAAAITMAGLVLSVATPAATVASAASIQCKAPQIGYETGTFVDGLQGQACYDGTRVWGKWVHSILEKKLPVVFATITGYGAFWNSNAYAGLGRPAAPAYAFWSNEYIHSPGVLDTLFRPVMEEWRYLRITVSPTGVVHACTWVTAKLDPAPPVSYTQGCY